MANDIAPTEQGFTLLEMLVALAVFSLAALALIRLQAVTLRTTADLDERQLGGIVAHNLMVDAQTTPDPLTMGDSEGSVENGGRQWRWTQKVAVTDAADIVRIDVRVLPASGSGSPAVLTFLRAQK
ncbi:MAG: type II secretion system minor pseudopilin GspI [Sphingobium sp.]